MSGGGYIDNVILFIEENLSEDINPGMTAKRHFISQSQLYRDFYSHTGHCVKEYIRKRRISNACEKIKCSDIPLAVIAGESGYQTQQAFHKQFRSIVGMTPLEYRQGDSYFCFYPFSADKISLAVRVGAETIPECETIKFYDSRLPGIEDRAIASLSDAPPKGRVFGRNAKQLGSRFCYEVMVQTEGAGKPGLYAACVVDYNERAIGDGWNYLYNTWLAGSMFEQSEEGYFEEYLFRDGRPYKLKLYLPVRKSGRARHIAIKTIPEMTFVTARRKGTDAERRAAECVISFLQEHCPRLITGSRRFYVCAYSDVCECGVECGAELCVPALADGSSEPGIGLLRIPAGRYAILPDECKGDIRVGAAKINLWLQNNAIAYENGPVFAVYETLNGGYDTEHISMKLYKRLKLTKTDNTETANNCIMRLL